MLITVNGRMREVPMVEASYEFIVGLADGKHGDTVTFHARRHDGWEKNGTLYPRGMVQLYPGMIFNVCNTGNA